MTFHLIIFIQLYQFLAKFSSICFLYLAEMSLHIYPHQTDLKKNLIWSSVLTVSTPWHFIIKHPVGEAHIIRGDTRAEKGGL